MMSHLSGYLVDENGEINFPEIGKIKISGLTKQECVDLFTEKLSKFIENPIITMSIPSFTVTVLGEVNIPGPVKAENDRLTILDAIVRAGDLTI